MIGRRSVTVSHRCEPVLGSVLDCRVIAHGHRAADRTIRFIIDEFERWEQLLSAHRPSSELRRWIDGRLGDDDVSAETSTALGRGIHWEVETGGTVSPQATTRERRPAFEITPSGRPRRIGDLRGLCLDAFAKGFVIDRVVDECVRRRGVVDVMISVGGDLRAAGPVGVTVGVEHPGRPFDNEAPIAHVPVRDAACATSGRSRRGDHLVDGRTGERVDYDGSAFVLAPTAEEADAWATHLCITAAPIDVEHVAWMLIDPQGRVITAAADLAR